MTVDLVGERAALRARLEGLKDELAEVNERQAAIKGQIEQAQATRRTTGAYADPDWFSRAKGALRHLGVDCNDIAREIGEVNRRLRELNASLSRDCFRDAVLEVVDEATWQRIVHLAEQLKEQRTSLFTDAAP